MPKLVPKRSFLLRIVDGKRIRAERGKAVEVSDEEWKKLNGYFTKPYPNKKGLSVK